MTSAASVFYASASSRVGDQTILDTASRRRHVGSKFSSTDLFNSWTRFYRPCRSMNRDLAASFWADLLTFGHGLVILLGGTQYLMCLCVFSLFWGDHPKIISVVIHHFCINCGGFIFIFFFVFVDDKFQDSVLG